MTQEPTFGQLNRERCLRQLSLFRGGYSDREWWEDHLQKTEAYARPATTDGMQITPDNITPGEPIETAFRMQYSSRKGARPINIERGWVKFKITGLDGLIDGDSEMIVRFRDVPRSAADAAKRRLIIPIAISTNHVDHKYPWVRIEIDKMSGFEMAASMRWHRASNRTWWNDQPHYELKIKIRNYMHKHHKIYNDMRPLKRYGYRHPPGQMHKFFHYM